MEEPDFPYPTQKYSRKAKWTVIISITLMITVGGIFLSQKPKKTEVKKVLAVEYRQLPNSPTAMPTKAKMNVTIEVLNGSGIPGQANKVMKMLEAEGYDIDNIKSGNAKTSDHVGTTITSRADLEERVTDIKKILSPLFPDISDGIQNTNPNDDSGYDIVITTGSVKTGTLLIH